jgi:hypothetical protein
VARDNLPLLPPTSPFATEEEGRQIGLARMAAIQVSIDTHLARMKTGECLGDYAWCSHCNITPGTPGAVRRQGLRL